jgi:hypothetical protein
MSCGILSVRWCDIFVLNVHAPTEVKSDVKKNGFYTKLERAFDQLISCEPYENVVVVSMYK